MKIYVITKGEHEDYRIITATTDKAVAEKLAEVYSDENWDKARVEEFEDARLKPEPVWRVCFESKNSVRLHIDANYRDINLVTQNSDGDVFVSVQADTHSRALEIAERLVREAGIY